MLRICWKIGVGESSDDFWFLQLSADRNDDAIEMRWRHPGQSLRPLFINLFELSRFWVDVFPNSWKNCSVKKNSNKQDTWCYTARAGFPLQHSQWVTEFSSSSSNWIAEWISKWNLSRIQMHTNWRRTATAIQGSRALLLRPWMEEKFCGNIKISLISVSMQMHAGLHVKSMGFANCIKKTMKDFLTYDLYEWFQISPFVVSEIILASSD